MNRSLAIFCISLTCTAIAHADNFYRLDEALPANVDISANYPVFDYTNDSCLPSAGISRTGQQNGGLNPSGSLTGGCRQTNFLDTSNTLHRHACVRSGPDVYCGHFYAMYALKDQVTVFGGGHRHEWEYAAIWTKDGVVTHGGYSKHGKLINQAIGTLSLQDGHLRIVYHKDGLLTHCMSFADADYVADNPYGTFVTPTIVSWATLKGDGLTNAQMREKLDTFDYGAADIPMRDDNFLSNLNTYKPDAYPAFSTADFDASGE